MVMRYYNTLSLLYLDDRNRCRWSTDPSEQLVFVRYNRNQLNIYDVQKSMLILKNPIVIENSSTSNLRAFLRYYDLICLEFTDWIDVCPTNSNLIAGVGESGRNKVL